jgi:predicted DNA-binding protein (MmcQ/YjbR family)
MNIERIRTYCLSKSGVEETLPFDDDVLVYKVGNKMFALISISKPDYVNLKCDPEYAIELRDRFNEVRPGFHMSKTHWNSVYFNGDVDDQLIIELIDHSYQLIVASLPKAIQKTLQ